MRLTPVIALLQSDQSSFFPSFSQVPAENKRRLPIPAQENTCTALATSTRGSPSAEKANNLNVSQFSSLQELGSSQLRCLTEVAWQTPRQVRKVSFRNLQTPTCCQDYDQADARGMCIFIMIISLGFFGVRACLRTYTYLNK